MEKAVLAIEFQQESNASSENESTESQNEWLVNDLKIMIERPEPSFSFECCIRRIPDHLRKVNEQAYVPMIISIGPFHHFDKKFQTMEKFKVRYLNSFIARANINLENLVSTIREMEERIYCCYAENSLDINQDYLLKVILVDAIFILELIYRSVNGCWESDDLLIAEQMTFILYDLALLENQLPFFVLEKLFNLIYPNCSNSSSLIDLTFHFFESFNYQKITPKNVKIEHFTDLIRIFQLPQLHSLQERQPGSEMVKLLYSAIQLHEAGVKFQVNSSKSLLDITFEFKNGVLGMPWLELHDGTETLIRNVMALEEFRYPTNKYVTDSFIFMDNLIDNTKDMDLLCDKKIVINHLGDNNAATCFFNNLNKNIIMPGINSNFNQICQNLNTFRETPWHRWKATLRHQYFSTPWRTASTSAAVILLVLTFIQTVCSIIK